MSGDSRAPDYRLAFAAGVGSALVLAAALRRLRPPAPAEEDLRRIGDELARVRAALAEDPDPVRALLDALAAELDRLSKYLEQVYEEAYLDTATGSSLQRLRDYDRELVRLAVEIRCRLARA